jgi:hypothetical protein
VKPNVFITTGQAAPAQDAAPQPEPDPAPTPTDPAPGSDGELSQQ